MWRIRRVVLALCKIEDLARDEHPVQHLAWTLGELVGQVPIGRKPAALHHLQLRWGFEVLQIPVCSTPIW